MEDPAADINPFVVDDPEEPLSEHESTGAKSEEAAASPAALSDAPLAESIVLSQSESGASPPAPTETVQPAPAAPIAAVAPQAFSPAPKLPAPAPASEAASSSDEETAPELHAPALMLSTLFLPVPNVRPLARTCFSLMWWLTAKAAPYPLACVEQADPLSALLTKYVPEPHLRPPRDVTGEWAHTDFHTLVMTNNWRSLAKMARDRIVTANPREVEVILNLWYIRLSSLARLRLFNQTAAECENLFSVLATLEPPASRTYILARVLPFELEVLRARCAYWAGDPLGYLDDVAALLARCRTRARAARDDGERSMWKERGARMALIVASQLVEMKEYTAATALLEPLCASGSSPPAVELRAALARIYLQAGRLDLARAHFTLVEAEVGAQGEKTGDADDPSASASIRRMNEALLAAAEGDWARAAAALEDAARGETDNVLAVSNYAVALLGMGKVKEAIEVMEAALRASPTATTTTEPFLFNLSTMYELRAGLAAHRKRDLLLEVAKWSGDGLRPACLKLGA